MINASALDNASSVTLFIVAEFLGLPPRQRTEEGEDETDEEFRARIVASALSAEAAAEARVLLERDRGNAEWMKHQEQRAKATELEVLVEDRTDRLDAARIELAVLKGEPEPKSIREEEIEKEAAAAAVRLSDAPEAAEKERR